MRPDRRRRLGGLAGLLWLGLAAAALLAPETGRAQQPAPEQPAPEQPAPEQPAPEQPAPEQPAPEQPAIEGRAFNEIVVGVRRDAAPFSYRLGGQSSTDLRQYGGYIVAICREVLERVVTERPFRGARITAFEIEAGSRFDVLSPEGGVDLLCDPTSITADRLERFYVSTPVFLSGAAIAEQQQLPKSYYCGSIVGFVGNTTSEHPALAEFARGKSFGRYGPAIARVLELVGLNERGGYDKARLEAMQHEPLGKDPAFANACIGELTAPPVVKFDSHDEGLAALCAGEILFYLADVDIISTYIQRRQAECPVLLSRNVLAIEQYGIFFKEIEPEGMSPFDPAVVKNQFLYSKFNMALHRLAREGEGVLLRAFKAPDAFGDRPRTEVLDRFFRMQSLGFR